MNRCGVPDANRFRHVFDRAPAPQIGPLTGEQLPRNC
jgi:hypothetical protein